MTKIILGGIVVVGVVSLVWAGAKGEKSPQPPGAVAVATARESSQSAGVSAGTQPVASTSQPANANKPTTMPSNESGAKNVVAALQQAADARKHLFVFVSEKDDEQAQEGRKTFDTAVRKLGNAVQWIAINKSAPSESEFVAKYGLQAAPMPIVLAFAPNGAIVGGFLGARLTEQQLVDGLASPGMQACLKALQDRKLVFLCAQNGTTKSNDTAMKGINEFKADQKFAQATEIVRIDPADAAEKKFLTQLHVDPKADQATTVFLTPPGTIVGKFSGATEKDKLVAALQKASSGCGAGGCGAGGCGPKGCPVKK
jgi:hypothetical protein